MCADKIRLKKKLVLTVWENIPFASYRTFKGLTDNKKIVDYVRDHTDVFIAITERAKIALQIEGVPEERIRTIPVGWTHPGSSRKARTVHYGSAWA